DPGSHAQNGIYRRFFLAAAFFLAGAVFFFAGAAFFLAAACFLAGAAFFLAGAAFFLAGAAFFLAGAAFFLAGALRRPPRTLMTPGAGISVVEPPVSQSTVTRAPLTRVTTPCLVPAFESTSTRSPT